MDLSLPGEGGLELVRRPRRRGNRVAIVAVAAQVTAQHARAR